MSRFQCHQCGLIMDKSERVLKQGNLGPYYECPKCHEPVVSIDELDKEYNTDTTAGYEALGQAILDQAKEDFDDALQKLDANPRSKVALKSLSEVLTYFKNWEDNNAYVGTGSEYEYAIDDPRYRKFCYNFKIAMIDDALAHISRLGAFDLKDDNLKIVEYDLKSILYKLEIEYENKKKGLNEEIKLWAKGYVKKQLTSE